MSYLLEHDNDGARSDSIEESINSSVVDEPMLQDAGLEFVDVNEVGVGEQKGSIVPTLYNAEPTEGCINADKWIHVEGHNIHWDSTVTLEYPFSGNTVSYVGRYDECGRSLVEWHDTSRISFRTKPTLAWDDGQVGFVSGYYLVKVISPEQEASNEVGIELYYCHGVVEEIQTCNQRNEQWTN